MSTRTAPNIPLSKVPDDYAILLWHGFDWWAEALDMKTPDFVWQRMRIAKDKAIELDDRKKTPVDFDFAGRAFQIMPTGAPGGKEFVVFNDDLRFEIGSRARSWSVNWRATAAGLAEWGVEALRKEVYDILSREGFYSKTDDYIRVTRVDYAFDYQSYEFTREMVPKLVNTIVTPSEVKTRADFIPENEKNFKSEDDGKLAGFFYSRGHELGEAKLKTITAGTKGGCQVQVYNKADEITEASGKTWMYDLWASGSDWLGDLHDIWRVECRMAGDWLKSRTKKNPETILIKIYELVADAIYNRRLTVPQLGDSNRRRWPLHPLYTLIIQECGSPKIFLPIGRQITGRADALEEALRLNIAGTIRSLITLKYGDYDHEKTPENVEEIVSMILADSEHEDKVLKAMERYQFVEEAK